MNEGGEANQNIACCSDGDFGLKKGWIQGLCKCFWLCLDKVEVGDMEWVSSKWSGMDNGSVSEHDLVNVAISEKVREWQRVLINGTLDLAMMRIRRVLRATIGV